MSKPCNQTSVTYDESSDKNNASSEILWYCVGMPMEAGRKDPPHQGTAGGTQQRKNARRTGAKYDVQ